MNFLDSQYIQIYILDVVKKLKSKVADFLSALYCSIAVNFF